MIVNQQGKPYSKRDGAAFVGEYREQGYLPEALFNYLLLLGWNPGDDREVLTREEMIKLFELEKVHVTAAMFDPKKLAWMNGEYIKKIPQAEFKALLKEKVKVGGEGEEWWDYLCAQVQPRTKFLNDLETSCVYLATDDYPFDEKAVAKRLAKDGVKATLLDLVERFEKIDDWRAPVLEEMVKGLSQGPSDPRRGLRPRRGHRAFRNATAPWQGEDDCASQVRGRALLQVSTAPHQGGEFR